MAEALVRADHRHWGAEVVDIRARDLPGLKAAFLVGHVPETGRVLEIGCGEGKMLRTLAYHRPSLSLDGCDVHQPTSLSREYCFRLVPGDGTLPYEDGAFDAVFVSDCLEHVPNPDRYMSEAARVLKSSGRFVACVPTEGQPLSFYRLYRALLGDDLYAVTKEHVQSFSRSSLRALVLRHFMGGVQARYAYHLAGHFMDATFFAAQRLAFLRKFWWRDNRYYNPAPANGMLTNVLNGLLRLGNAVAWLESRALSRIPLTSAAMLIVARKR